MALEYESGKRVKFDLPKAYEHFNLARTRGFSGPVWTAEDSTLRFLPALDAISMSPSAYKQMLELYRYFRENDMGVPPVNQQERLERAQPLSVDYAARLYIPEIDGENAPWLAFMSGAYEASGNHSEAWKFLLQASKAGDAQASYKIALAYEAGQVVSIDLDAAHTYFVRAREQGYVGAITDAEERILKFIPELNEATSNKAARGKLVDLYVSYRDNGLGLVPVRTSERFQKHFKFTGMVPPQYKHAYALFIEEIDGEDPEWLAAAAFILDMHLNNDDLFNPQKAEKYNIKAAELGNSMAAFNLGVKYHTGSETEIDLDEALRWYRRADKLGDRIAKHRIANILKEQIALDYPNIENPYTDEIVQLYKAGYDQKDLVAAKNYARLFINGIRRHRNPEFAIQIYDWIITRKPSHAEEITHANVAYLMAMRSFLGVDTPKDNEKSLSYLDKISDESNHASIRYTLKEGKQRLKEYITSDSQGDNEDLALIRRLHENPDEIPEVIAQFDQGKSKSSRRLANYVICMRYLARAEEWPSRYDWNDMCEAVQAHQLGFSFAQAVQSTKDSGPRYTSLDERGMPILGSLMKPSADEQEEINDKKVTGSYVPQPGLIKLRRIAADAEGFKYYGAYSEDLPAMLTEEDRQISEILAFGDTERGPLFPVLSLETENNDEYGKGAKGNGYDKAFTYKIFTPQWLAYTDFGRTLWITDYLIGQWCWTPEKFKIGDPENCSYPDQHFKAKEFIKDLRLTGGRDGGASSARVMIQPQSDYILPEAPKEGETVYRQDAASVDIKQMTMKVYGSYVLNDGNTENRSLFEEDPNFAQGRTVKKLTDRYNDIMQFDPRFERAQQLMGLFYGHFRLWQIGYRPSEVLQQDLTAKLRVMEKLGRDKDERLLVRRSFGSRPYLGS